jgi:hypothetical protein
LINKAVGSHESIDFITEQTAYQQGLFILGIDAFPFFICTDK